MNGQERSRLTSGHAPCRQRHSEKSKTILNTSRLTPLNKSKPGKIGPIAVGNTWRKMSAWVISDRCSAQLKASVGESQYGVYTPSGVAIIEVLHDAHLHPHSVFMQFDARNAIGSIDHRATLAAAAAASPHYHATVAAWLCDEQHALLSGTAAHPPCVLTTTQWDRPGRCRITNAICPRHGQCRGGLLAEIGRHDGHARGGSPASCPRLDGSLGGRFGSPRASPHTYPPEGRRDGLHLCGMAAWTQEDATLGPSGADEYIRAHPEHLEERLRLRRRLALKRIPQELGLECNGAFRWPSLTRNGQPHHSCSHHGPKHMTARARRCLRISGMYVGPLTQEDDKLMQFPFNEGGLQWKWAATAASLQFLAASQPITVAQDMWQPEVPELLQAEADASALLCTSARDILRSEGAKANPKPFKAFYAKLLCRGIADIIALRRTEAGGEHPNCSTHLQMLLPLVDLTLRLRASIMDGPSKLMLRQCLSRPLVVNPQPCNYNRARTSAICGSWFDADGRL
eukprot:3590403-Amphidinium_carterae.1